MPAVPNISSFFRLQRPAETPDTEKRAKLVRNKATRCAMLIALALKIKIPAFLLCL